MLQLTGMNASGQFGAMISMGYTYSATQNNGRIVQSSDGLTGEMVTYTYDALNRLIAAQATNNSWGNAYSYDGFGNLTAKTVTAGSAPSLTQSVDPGTNRAAGFYDANGNWLNGQYGLNNGWDVENRMVQSVPDHQLQGSISWT